MSRWIGRRRGYVSSGVDLVVTSRSAPTAVPSTNVRSVTAGSVVQPITVGDSPLPWIGRHPPNPGHQPTKTFAISYPLGAIHQGFRTLQWIVSNGGLYQFESNEIVGIEMHHISKRSSKLDLSDIEIESV